MFSSGQTKLYTEDWIGLKTLDDAGRVKYISVPGNHLGISHSDMKQYVVPYLEEKASAEVITRYSSSHWLPSWIKNPFQEITRSQRINHWWKLDFSSMNHNLQMHDCKVSLMAIYKYAITLDLFFSCALQCLMKLVLAIGIWNCYNVVPYHDNWNHKSVHKNMLSAVICVSNIDYLREANFCF